MSTCRVTKEYRLGGGGHNHSLIDERITTHTGIALNGKITTGEISNRSAFNDMFNTNVYGHTHHDRGLCSSPPKLDQNMVQR